MSTIWIWNSMACRRRSASDTFEENGIHILQKSLKKHGHHVKIIDWANQTGYASLSPIILRKINRYYTKKILNSIKNKKEPSKHIALISFFVQSSLYYIQKKRMKNKLINLAKQIRRNKIRFLGIKVWYGEAFTWSKHLTAEVKKYSPETIIIAGGYHATLYEEDILKHSNFDLAVIKEGEHILKSILDLSSKFSNWQKDTFLNSLKYSIKKHSLPGIIYRDNNKIIKIPYNSYNHIIDKDIALPFYEQDSGKVKIHILMESLGCKWNKCNFCVHNQFVPVYKKRMIKEIINELKVMIRQNIGLFRFAGSDTPPEFGKEIGNAILDNNLKVEYTMGSRAIKQSKDKRIYDSIVDAYNVMLKSGLRGVFIGGETGNDKINNNIMNKGLTSEDIINTIKAIREAEGRTGIKIAISLAIIHPTPLIDLLTHDDVISDNLYLLSCAKPDSVMVTPPCPFKNSKWFKNRKDFKFEFDDSFVPAMMEYEYVLYKPLTLWSDLPIRLNNQNFKDCIKESQKMRNLIEEELKIPTDLSDEHFLMIQCANLFNKDGVNTFKSESLIDIISSDYSYIDAISKKVNEYSHNLAKINL